MKKLLDPDVTEVAIGSNEVMIKVRPGTKEVCLGREELLDLASESARFLPIVPPVDPFASVGDHDLALESLLRVAPPLPWREEHHTAGGGALVGTNGHQALHALRSNHQDSVGEHLAAMAIARHAVNNLPDVITLLEKAFNEACSENTDQARIDELDAMLVRLRYVPPDKK